MVSKQERRLANQLNNDITKVLRDALLEGLVQASRMYRLVVKIFATDGDPIKAVRSYIDMLIPSVRDTMILAYLRGIDRSDSQREFRRIQFSAFTESLTFLKKRLEVSPKEYKQLQDRFAGPATKVVQKASQKAERKVKEAMFKIQTEQLHVSDGIKELKKAFADAGLTPDNKFTLEAIYRTQTQIAYSAGRWKADQDPDIQEILWGYKYVTVGDERVRPEHAVLEGITLPKDDPRWNEIFPPNGWACRCQAIPIFEERKIVEPPIAPSVNGKIIQPGPPDDFKFNPGKLFDVIVDVGKPQVDLVELAKNSASKLDFIEKAKVFETDVAKLESVFDKAVSLAKQARKVKKSK